MRTIVFDSPYQQTVHAAEFDLMLYKGKPVEVEDHVAELLLLNPHISEPGKPKQEVIITLPPDAEVKDQVGNVLAYVAQPAIRTVVAAPPEEDHESN